MSAADDAYAVAERRIAEAKANGADKLSLSQKDTRALTQIPPEIIGLETLHLLNLDNTQIADLTPIAGMTRITSLSLDNTQIADLTPIAGMTRMTHLSLKKHLSSICDHCGI